MDIRRANKGDEKKMKNKLRKVSGIAKAILLVSVLITFASMPANSATPEEIEASIDSGIAWLAAQQKQDGSWYGGSPSYNVGTTGLALLKLKDYAKEHGYDPEDPNYIYSSNVIAGIAYLDSQQLVSAVPVGKYDGNGNGNMINFNVGFDMTYQTSIALMAYSSDPSTPADVIQDITDYLVNTQCQDSSLNSYGSWYYTGVSCNPDNSNTGYATLGLAYALDSGATIPDSTKTALSVFVDYIQNQPGIADDGGQDDPDGGSGYTTPSSWVNSLKTGNLIIESVFVGDPVNSPRILNAIDYISRHWNDNIEGWKGSPLGNPPYNIPYNTQYQTTFSVMKGFEAIGLTDLNGVDWFDAMSTVIVGDQNDDGSWSGCPAYVWPDGYPGFMPTAEICTSWALLTLEKVTPIKPGSISGMKFNDLDGDGVQDAGETGIANWEIVLTSGDGTETVLTTDINGNYKITNVMPGTYVVSENVQIGWEQTFPVAPGTYEITITDAGEQVTDINFGNTNTGSIAGMKFNDINGDGVKDADEPGLEGWTIVLTSEDGTIVDTMKTDADGNFMFDDVLSGMYVVSEEVTLGWMQTFPVSESYQVELKPGAELANYNFGNVKIDGRMTGGGSVFMEDDTRVTHGFELHCDVSDMPNNLQVNWGKGKEGNNFHLETLGSAICYDNSAIEPNPPTAGFDTYEGNGMGRYNGVSGATATWTFTDAGEPGKDDMATLVIVDVNGNIVLDVSGNLNNGNQQAHAP